MLRKSRKVSCPYGKSRRSSRTRKSQAKGLPTSPQLYRHHHRSHHSLPPLRYNFLRVLPGFSNLNLEFKLGFDRKTPSGPFMAISNCVSLIKVPLLQPAQLVWQPQNMPAPQDQDYYEHFWPKFFRARATHCSPGY